MSLAGRAGQRAYAESTFAWLRSAGHAPNVHAYTSLLRAYGSDWRAALSLLDGMQAAGVSPNAHTLSACLAACCRGGTDGAAAAVPLFSTLATSLPVDAHLCATFITLFGRLRDAEGAQRVWAWAGRQGVRVDAHLHCAYLTALMRAGAAQEAAHAFRAMPVPPSAHCYAAGMRALGAAGLPVELVRAVLDDMRVARVPPTPHVYAALMGAFARDGDADGALALLQEGHLQQEGLPAVCTHLAMAACARAGRVADALTLLERLRSARAADVVSFSTAMLAAAVAAAPDEAERLYAQMLADGIRPNDYTFTALIASHGGAARAAASRRDSRSAAACLRRARAVRDRMALARVMPSVHTYNAWIAAAEGAVDDGAALGDYESMRAAGVAPNKHTRALMAIVSRRGAEQITAAQSSLTALSAVAAALAAALIQRGWM